MPSAQSLEDLLRIRAANRNLIDSINGNLGSALGFKKATDQAISDEPAVLIFVPRKIDNNWLPADQRIPKKLTGPGGLECPTDVVEGGKYDEIFLQETDITGTTDLGVREWRDLLGGAPLSEENLNLLEVLHGWSEKMVPGSRVAGLGAQGGGYTGTAGCFVRDRETQNLGILTNHHVADRRGNVLMYPWFNGPNAAVVTKLREYVRDEHRFPGVVDQPEEYYRIDCAFAALTPALVNEIDFEAPSIGAFGEPLPLDIDTMGPVGVHVTSIGSRRGIQTGTMSAFSYEYNDGQDSIYTDYLIIGDEDVDEHGRQVTRTAFSDRGDSGKMILTDDDEHRVVALLWGGWWERLRPGKMQENWTYAIDINYVMGLLNLEWV